MYSKRALCHQHAARPVEWAGIQSKPSLRSAHRTTNEAATWQERTGVRQSSRASAAGFVYDRPHVELRLRTPRIHFVK